MTLQAVDCQSFAGGFTMGAVNAGFELVGKRELPGGFGVASCEANRHLLGTKWTTEIARTETGEDWTPMDVPLVFGNPPCSGFSLLSRSDFRGADSRINACMWAFARYAARCRPDVAIFESVQQAYKQGRELMQALRNEVEVLTGEQYQLFHVLHNAAALGGCAIRKRYFFLISKVPFGIEPPKVNRIPTFRQVIADLEGLAITWEKQPYRKPPSWWARRLRNQQGVVDGHYVRFNPLVNRARDLMEQMEWPEGDNISNVARRYYQTFGRLPDSWSSTADKLIGNDFKMGFYQMHRWKADSTARVVTGAACQLVLHPTEARPLTNREAARIQGFPDAWSIGALRQQSGVDMLWGKGIPVQCGTWIAGWAKQAIIGEPGPWMGMEIGDREYVIDTTNNHVGVPIG